MRFPRRNQRSSPPDPPSAWRQTRDQYGVLTILHNNLPVVYQQDLIQGVKYARLFRNQSGDAEFRGVARGKGYGTEAYAECAAVIQLHASAECPDAACSCGFWVPARPESALSSWERDTVRLEVEIGGRILECSRDPDPAHSGPWGYRAQWQRVLSVTLPDRCASPGCISKPEVLGVRHAGSVWQVCARHSMDTVLEVINRPVSWLRRSLRTEIRPGFVTDDAAGAQRAWRDAVELVTSQLCMMSVLRQALPETAEEGDRFRVCASIPDRLVYELEWHDGEWIVDAVYHPALAPWGWGAPGA